MSELPDDKILKELTIKFGDEIRVSSLDDNKILIESILNDNTISWIKQTELYPEAIIIKYFSGQKYDSNFNAVKLLLKLMSGELLTVLSIDSDIPSPTQNTEITLYDWDKIKFLDYRVQLNYEGINYTFANPESRKEYEHIKYFYSSHSFSYSINLVNSVPTNLIVTDDIFDYLEISKELAVFIKKNKKSIYGLQKTTNKFDNSVDKLIKIFGKKKNNYIRHLASKHSALSPIKTIFEPNINQNSIENFDLSFLFTIIKKQWYFLVWESIEFSKATYIIAFSNKEDYNHGLNLFYSFVYNKDGYLGRMELRNSNKFRYMYYFNHNNESNLDDKWREKLNEIILRHVPT